MRIGVLLLLFIIFKQKMQAKQKCADMLLKLWLESLSKFVFVLNPVVVRICEFCFAKYGECAKNNIVWAYICVICEVIKSEK